MIGKKSDIEKALVFADNETEYYFEELPLKAEQRTKAQNRTFNMCFKVIGKKMGEHKDIVKQNCLKGLFGVSKNKFGGVWYENAIIGSTTQLSKEQAILLIDTLVVFGKKLGCGEIVTPRELSNLFNNN